MKRSYLIALAGFMLPLIATAAKEAGNYEFTDPEDSVHVIFLSIDGKKISGTVTKFIGGFESKLGKMEAKFDGRVISGSEKKGRKLEISMKGGKHNLDSGNQNKAVWVLDANGDLKVPVLLPIGRQPYREIETFRAQDYH
jgi:hypothetical protein